MLFLSVSFPYQRQVQLPWRCDRLIPRIDLSQVAVRRPRALAQHLITHNQPNRVARLSTLIPRGRRVVAVAGQQAVMPLGVDHCRPRQLDMLHAHLAGRIGFVVRTLQPGALELFLFGGHAKSSFFRRFRHG